MYRKKKSVKNYDIFILNSRFTITLLLPHKIRRLFSFTFKLNDMNRLITAFAALLLMACFNDCLAQAKSKDTEGANMDKDYPYKATYSSNFKIGKAAYAKMVLELWKDWDDNNFDRHDFMADSIVMLFPDGTIMKGKEEAMAGAKKFRGSFASAKSTVHAWLPLTSTDKNEDAVCIWGQEEDTYTDGKVEKKDIHEVWWFNKAGKVTRMRQWAAKFGD